MAVTKNIQYSPIALKKEVFYGTNPNPTRWNPIMFQDSAIPTITRSTTKELVMTAEGRNLAHKMGLTESAYHYVVDFPATRMFKNDMIFIAQMFLPNYEFDNGTHKLTLDADNNLCFNNTYTMLLPLANCAGVKSAYEVNGLIPQTITLDFSNATFAMTAIAKNRTDISTNIPNWVRAYDEGDYYLEDSSGTGTVNLTPYNTNYDKIQVYDGGFNDSNIVNQLTSNVVTISFNVSTDRVSKNNGVMANVIKSLDKDGSNIAFNFAYDRLDTVHNSIIAGDSDITQDYYLKSMVDDGSYSSAVVFDSKIQNANISGNNVEDMDGVDATGYILVGDNTNTITIEIVDDHGDLTTIF